MGKELTKPILDATPQKALQAVEHALSRYEGMQPGEERGDVKFADILSVKTFIDEVVGGYMDSIAQDQLVALSQVNGSIMEETGQTTTAIEGQDMKGYITGMSGLVSRACQAVGLATKVQAAKKRDLDGYKAELSESALEMLEGVKQTYLGEGNGKA
jgi:hypothetical protein